MTTDLKKNSQQFLPSIDRLERLRVTGVKDFTTCPRMWKAKQLGEGVQKESPYARRGTAVHYVIEKYLLGELDVPGSSAGFVGFLKDEGVPADEIDNVFQYLGILAPLRPHLLHVEKQVGFGHCAHWRPIQGHVDAIFSYNDEGDVLILDHKTNRSFRGSDWWKQQPQPRLYAWLVRRLIPTARDVYFAIGYVNLDRRVVWRTDPADDKWCYERYTSMLDEIQVYTRTGEWPERINPDCRYCPVKATCPSLTRAGGCVANTVPAVIAEEVFLGRYRWALDVQKSIEGVVEEMRERLVEIATERGEFIEGGYRARLRTSSRRSVSFTDAWRAVAPLVSAPDLIAVELFDDVSVLEQVFKPQMGAIDKLATKYPPVAVRLEGRVVEKEVNPTLVVEEITDADTQPEGVSRAGDAVA